MVKYIITISICSVDNITYTDLQYTGSKQKLSASEHLKIDKFTQSFLSGKSCIWTSCVHKERTVRIYVLSEDGCKKYSKHVGVVSCICG